MKRPVSLIVLGFIFGTQAFLFQNCSATKFSGDAVTVDSSSVGPLACQPGVIQTNRNVKILMIVDTSGSNQQQPDGTLGTDPQRKWRLQAINSLINRYGTKNNFHFGLTVFQDTFSKPQIRLATGEGILSNSQAVVQDGLSNFANVADRDGTPYLAGLSLAKSILQRDLSSNPADNSLYSLVLISDGMPTDVKSVDTLNDTVSSITALAPGRVNINTVFYYNSQAQKDSIDTKYLQAISRAGQGTFITADANQTIQLDDKIAVSNQACE